MAVTDVRRQSSSRWRWWLSALQKHAVPFAELAKGRDRRRFPSEPEIEVWIAEYNRMLQQRPDLTPEVWRIDQAERGRLMGFAQRASGALTGLSILVALIAGGEAAYWLEMTTWEQLTLLVADAYLLVALWSGLQAVRPAVVQFMGFDVIEDAIRDESRYPTFPAALRVAAGRLACVRANERSLLRAALYTNVSLRCLTAGAFVAIGVGIAAGVLRLG